MKIILKKDIVKLGKAGEVVTVKDGYARNFLFPRRLALKSTPNNLRLLEQENRTAQIRAQKKKAQAELLAQKLSSLSCTIPVEAKEDDALYGSVTEADIARAFEVEGYKLDKGQFCLDEPIKKLGIYSIPVRLHPEVMAKLKVWVVKK